MVDAYIGENGILSAERGAKLSAGALRVKVGDHYGVTRGRGFAGFTLRRKFRGRSLLSIKARME